MGKLYNGTLDADTQVTAEEQIAALIFDYQQGDQHGSGSLPKPSCDLPESIHRLSRTTGRLGHSLCSPKPIPDPEGLPQGDERR